MDKPIALAYHETKERIINIINSSNLPAFAITSIIEKIYTDLLNLEKVELENAKKVYEENNKLPKEKEKQDE